MRKAAISITTLRAQLKKTREERDAARREASRLRNSEEKHRMDKLLLGEALRKIVTQQV